MIAAADVRWITETASLVAQMVRTIVDHPDEVSVSASKLERTVVLRLSVAQKDYAQLLGQDGRTARALRTLTSDICRHHEASVFLEITPDGEHKPAIHSYPWISAPARPHHAHHH